MNIIALNGFIKSHYIKFCRCIVLFDGDEIVQVDKKVKKDDEECEKFEKAKVCISKHEDKNDGIYACQLAIEDMNEDLEGWFINRKILSATRNYLFLNIQNELTLITIYVHFLGNWEVEVKAGKEEGSVEFDVAIDESSGGMIMYILYILSLHFLFFQYVIELLNFFIYIRC